MLYAGVALLRRHDPLRSQAGVGIAGVVLVSMTVAAGLGFCALLGIVFNASTTQIVPFLALGLGVDDMFLITASYAEQDMTEVRPHVSHSPMRSYATEIGTELTFPVVQERTGAVLRRTGFSVLLTSLSCTCALFAASLISIPALRVFSIQAAVLVLFNLVAMLLVFPALVSLDLRRRQSNRVDLFCCVPLPSGQKEAEWPCFGKGPSREREDDQQKLQAVARAVPPDRQHTVTLLAPEASEPKQPSVS